ncbi:MAG: sulfur carrier protein ThiS [Candidatus Tumulicola sp.]
MKATINGEARDLPDGLTVAMLLEMLGTARTGVAVAHNDCVVRRSQYDAVRIGDGDRVEIIKAVAGG